MRLRGRADGLVKNKTPAAIQITAEQILKEAHDRRETIREKPRQKITDPEELAEYCLHKRKQFEDIIRRNRHHFSHWLKYAAWEEAQGELARARSVFERVIEVDHRNPAIWTRYAEFEMRAKNINLARNLWDRACSLLPRVDQFWYKFAYMEEMLGDVAAARQVFERWMAWIPAVEAWDAFVAFELRYKEVDRAKEVLTRLVKVHPVPEHWVKLAKFTQDYHSPADEMPAATRAIFEQAVAVLGDELISADLLLAFAQFEIKCCEIARAREIFKLALHKLPKSEGEVMYQNYVNFERRYGERPQIDEAIANRRRWVYKAEIDANPLNFDVWFDLISLEENAAASAGLLGEIPDHRALEVIRDTFEHAVAQIPPTTAGKRLWRRYIYLWLLYAAFEEISARDRERACHVFEACLEVIPHREFTFSKVWLQFSMLLVRMMDLPKARKTLGWALGMCPKPKLFKGYIALELELLEFDRVRTIYLKFLEHAPGNVYAWIKFAQLERTLGDIPRCRAIYDLATSQPVLDQPEVLWQTYIDFEISENEWDAAKMLYRRLLERTTHVRVWIGLAKLEMQAAMVSGAPNGLTSARAVFEEGSVALRHRMANEERVALLEAWHDFEKEHGTDADAQAVAARFPRITPADSADGFLYAFPEDAAPPPEADLLTMARAWKQQADNSE